MKKKAVKIWIILIVSPFVLLALTAITQMAVRFALAPSDAVPCSNSSLPMNESVGLDKNGTAICEVPSNHDIVKLVVNIFSLLIGVIAVIGMLGLPVWITMLVIAINHNNHMAGGASPPGPQPPLPPVGPMVV